MSVSHEKLPPSERDFEVYERHVVERASSRETARELGISQTRVLQICQRVFEFLATDVPQSPNLTDEQRLRGAQFVAEEQLGNLYRQSMVAWRNSQGRFSVTREKDGQAVKTTRDYFGEPRYLQQAMRVTLAQLQIYERPVRDARRAEAKRVGCNSGTPRIAPSENVGCNSGTPRIAPASNGVLREYADTSYENPPVRACSAMEAPREEVTEMPAEAGVVTAEEASTCDDQSAQRAEFFGRLADVSRPVQLVGCNSGTPRIAPASNGALREYADTPYETETATLPNRQPLNRKERRKRQRLLARALARRGK